MRDTTHGDRGEISPEDSTRKAPREKTNLTEVGPCWVITVIENKNLWSELSRNKKVPGLVPFSTCLAFSPLILPQYQHDSRNTDNAALTVSKSMILCSAFFSFRWRELGLCSRFLNWSKAETHGVSISFFFFFSLITQFASDPHEWARRMLGDLTMHGPQYADRTCWVHFFRFFSLFFSFVLQKMWMNN